MSMPEGEPVVDLLNSWRFSTRRMQYCHFAAANRFRRRHFWVGIPTTIASIVVGTSVFAALAKDGLTPLVKIAVGCISVSAAVLSGLQTFLRYESRAERHRQAAVQFGAIRWEIEQYQALRRPGQEVDGDKEFLEMIRKRMAEIPRTLPEIPQDLWNLREKLSREVGREGVKG